jgi:hypothetical protein
MAYLMEKSGKKTKVTTNLFRLFLPQGVWNLFSILHGWTEMPLNTLLKI